MHPLHDLATVVQHRVDRAHVILEQVLGLLGVGGREVVGNRHPADVALVVGGATVVDELHAVEVHRGLLQHATGEVLSLVAGIADAVSELGLLGALGDAIGLIEHGVIDGAAIAGGLVAVETVLLVDITYWSPITCYRRFPEHELRVPPAIE